MDGIEGKLLFEVEILGPGLTRIKNWVDRF